MESKTIEEVLAFLCENLGGDWLLTGGALVRLNFDENRGTEDLDLVRIRHPELSDEAAKNQLFKWLIQRGLGPEWVNSAVEPFVREVEEWDREVVLLRDGPRGKIFRPCLTLFVYLKLRRGSEIDLADIQKAAENCVERFDEAKFLTWAKGNKLLLIRYQSIKSWLGRSTLESELGSLPRKPQSG